MPFKTREVKEFYFTPADMQHTHEWRFYVYLLPYRVYNFQDAFELVHQLKTYQPTKTAIFVIPPNGITHAGVEQLSKEAERLSRTHRDAENDSWLAATLQEKLQEFAATLPTVQEIDFHLNPSARKKAIADFVGDYPYIWADPEKVLPVVMGYFQDSVTVHYRNRHILAQAIRKMAHEERNLKLLIEALEASFKYGRQKMTLRQKLYNNPLRDFNPINLAGALNQGAAPQRYPEVYDTMKREFADDPENWWEEYVSNSFPR